MADKTGIMTRRTILVFSAVLVGAAAIAGGGFGGGGFIGGGMGGAMGGGIAGEAVTRNRFYVDVVHGNDDNEGLTPGTAFATIQRGIDTAADNDIVLVYPGLYREEINFLGKALVVQGIASGAAGIPVLDNPGDFAVSFYNGEGPDSVLKNFVIRNNFMAVFLAGSSPTISNLTIVDNMYGIEASAGSEPEISNIIFWNNTYSDLFGCQVRYSCISGTAEGEGNIGGDPLFVDPQDGDYHLRSWRGRYWIEHDVWILDQETSPCIDGGDPISDALDEPIPNGDRTNMGAYGGTAQASLSPERLPGRAFNPSPANGAVEVDRNARLSWNPGLGAVSHDIYFGTEHPLPFVSDQRTMPEQPTIQFSPGWMDSETVYYWRIDEIDSEGAKTVGAVWKFTTSFASGPPPKGRACFVPETGVWVDGSLVSISNVGIGRSISWADGIGPKNSPVSLSFPGKIEELQEHEGVFECYDVLLESGNRIGVAERHYFLTESGNWVAVQNLKTGTKLQTPRGSIAIMNVARRLMPYTGKVYNLKVAGSDRYLVGKDAVIVRDY